MESTLDILQRNLTGALLYAGGTTATQVGANIIKSGQSLQQQGLTAAGVSNNNVGLLLVAVIVIVVFLD